MGYNYWKQDSQLFKHVEACMRLQRTSDNPISQPRNENRVQNGYMQPVVIDNQAVYDGDATIDRPLCPPASSIAVPPLLNQEMNWYIDESTAWQSCHNTPASSQVLSDTYRSDSPPTMPKSFHTGTYDYRQCASSEPILNGEVEPEPDSSNTCMWYDGEELCSQTIEGVARRKSRFYSIPQDPSSKITCRRCGKPLRRDTIARHIREVHLKQSRRSSKKSTHTD